MTKKNIQVILSILALTLLSLGGLYYFSQQSKKEEAQVEKQKKPVAEVQVEKPSVLSNIEFLGDDVAKKITLSQISKKNYRVRLFDAGNGFSIVFPNTESTLNSEYINPLPWVHSISFEQKQFRGQSSVEMTVSTMDGVALFDQFQDGALVIELQSTKANVGEDTAVKESTPVKKETKTVSKPKPAPTKTAKAPAPKPTPKPAPKPAPLPKEEVEPVFPDTFSDSQDNNFAFEEDTSSGSDLFSDDTDAGEIVMDESLISGEEFDAGDNSQPVSIMDLETSFSLGDGSDGSEQGSQEVAALPSDQGKFDMGSSAQITMIQSMQVTKTANGRTSVRFDRDASVPYKIFRLRNPSRIVVDFKDSEARFNGSDVTTGQSSVKRVETQAFESNDSKLLRVIMYLDNDAEYVANKDGNALILELP